MKISQIFLIIAFFVLNAQAQETLPPVVVANTTEVSLTEICIQSLSEFQGFTDKEKLRAACEKTLQLEGCESVQKKKIYHFDKLSSKADAPKILVFSLIHGDETPAGSVGRLWMERLHEIDPRNSWRIIPILNPDGVLKKTRTNGNNVDLNRNFPTGDWEALAQQYWKSKTDSNPRRYPGDQGGSEPETKCALKHIEDYKPDFTVSIHTPLKVLDFDGPQVRFPKYTELPWRRLGHFPGSLGRYLWFERSRPLLTLEWTDTLPKKSEPLERLHDVIGQLVKIEMSEGKIPKKVQY